MTSREMSNENQLHHSLNDSAAGILVEHTEDNQWNNAKVVNRNAKQFDIYELPEIKTFELFIEDIKKKYKRDDKEQDNIIRTLGDTADKKDRLYLVRMLQSKPHIYVMMEVAKPKQQSSKELDQAQTADAVANATSFMANSVLNDSTPAAADQVAADPVAADKEAAGSVAADKEAAEQGAEKAAAEKEEEAAEQPVAADKEAAGPVAADKEAAEQAAAERAAAEKAAAQQAPVEQAAVEQAAEEKAAEEKAAEEKTAPDTIHLGGSRSKRRPKRKSKKNKVL